MPHRKKSSLQLEVNFKSSGNLSLIEPSSGQVWPLEPDVVFAVGPKDRHRVCVEHDLHAVSIFNPPLTGTEVYDEKSALPSTGPLP